jgi:hypothetical protein
MHLSLGQNPPNITDFPIDFLFAGSGKYLPLRKISTSQENIFLRGEYFKV